MRDEPWWREAVIYQLYLRSFADGDGDGIGDLTGARSRLPYLRDLGVDAVWMSPWYASPMVDGGYDVADYRAIESSFGRLADAEAFIHDALDLGIRTIVDIVPNHVSDQHAWFEQAIAGGPGSPARDRFWFRPGRGPNGDVPPNRWTSHFGDIAWTRTKDPDGSARRLVPAPVLPWAAGPQLAAPRRVARARGPAAVLVRPRRGRSAHRLGGAGDQGP